MNGLQEPTCSVGINTITSAMGGKGCDVTYTITCIAGTNDDKVEAEALSQTTADACTASIEVSRPLIHPMNTFTTSNSLLHSPNNTPSPIRTTSTPNPTKYLTRLPIFLYLPSVILSRPTDILEVSVGR